MCLQLFPSPAQKYLPKTTSQLLSNGQRPLKFTHRWTLLKPHSLSSAFGSFWKNISALACRGSVNKCFQANSEFHITVSREQEFNLISYKRTKEGWIKSFDDELCAGFLWWNVGDSWDERSGVERCHDASDYGGGEASLVQLLFPIWWGNEILAMSLLSFYSNAFQHNSPAWCENTSILTKSKQKSAQRNKNLIWFISHVKQILSALKHQFLPSELCDFILYLVDYLQTVVRDENCS